MITVQPGSASGHPAQTVPTSKVQGTCAAILSTAVTTIDIKNVGVPSGGSPFFNNTLSSYALAITKVIQHELGHTMGLGDEPVDPTSFQCGGQTPGLTVMNGEGGTNDSGNLDPIAPALCDVTSIRNNPQLSANRGCQPPPPPINCECPGGCPACTDVIIGKSGDLQPQPDARNGTCCVGSTPILLDTSGKGYHLTSAAGGVSFDMSGTGRPFQTGWTAEGSDNAFLALPGADGLVHNGKQLFGNYTPQPVSKNPNGFAALEVYDLPVNGGNGDGIIDSRDAIYTHLRLWIDTNHDGICQPEAMHTLPSLGVTSISLNYKMSAKEDQYGNIFRYRAAVDPNEPDPDHVGPTAYDVYFVSIQSEAEAKKCPVPILTKLGIPSISGDLRK